MQGFKEVLVEKSCSDTAGLTDTPRMRQPGTPCLGTFVRSAGTRIGAGVGAEWGAEVSGAGPCTRGVYFTIFMGFCRSHIFTDFDYADPTFFTYSIMQTSSR